MADTGGRRREGWSTSLWAGLAVGFVALLPFLRGLSQGHSFFFRDLARYFFPVRRFYTDGLQHGELRLWNPFAHEGFSDLPLMFYPLDLLQLLRNDEWMYSLELALHVALGAIGMMLLLRSLGAQRLAAAGGGLLYALSGYGLSLLNLDIALRAYAWAPAIALALRWAAAGGARAVAVAALVSGVALSTLSPEILLQAILAALLMAGWPLERRRLARLAAALVLAVGLASVPLLLQSRLIAGSARSLAQDPAMSLSYSVTPLAWLQVLVANLFGDLSHLGTAWWGLRHFDKGFPYVLSLYVGPTALALAVAGLATGMWMRKRTLALLIVGVIVCLGAFVGLNSVLGLLPFGRLFRYPVKAFFTVQLALTLAAAGGLQGLASNRRGAWRALAGVAGTLGGLLVLARLLWLMRPDGVVRALEGLFPVGSPLPQRRVWAALVIGDSSLGGALALAAALVAALVLFRRLRSSLGTALVLALMVGDLLRAGAGLNPMVTGDYYRLSPEAAEVFGTIAREDGRLFTCDILAQGEYYAARRLASDKSESYTFAALAESATPHANVPFHIRTALSRDLFRLVPVARTLEGADLSCASFDSLVPRLRLAGVTHVVSANAISSPALEPWTTIRPARLAPLSLRVYRLVDPLPRFELATDVRTTQSAEEAQQAFSSPALLHPGTVLVEATAQLRGASGQVALLSERPGKLVFQADASGDSVLVVREGFDATWKATVNGTATPVWRANGRHMAIAVPTGSSRVELALRPWQLRAGLLFSALSAIAIAALGLFPRRGAS